MKLTLIATPIGNDDDITLRALEALRISPIIICEEFKVLRRRLSKWGIPPQEKDLHQLNEHTSDEDLADLLELCKNNEICLVTDCGTPSFFDPGFKLVDACHKNGIEVQSLPGVSSMTALFPFLKEQTQRFEVVGFPPRNTSDRISFFKEIKANKHPVLMLDTPYRLKKTMEELIKILPTHQCVLGVNLTCDDERVVYGTPEEILKEISDLNKENFVCMIYPKK